jgi:hypothetical protein
LDLAVDQVDFARTLVVVACLLVWIAGKMKDVFLAWSFHQLTRGHVDLPDEGVPVVAAVVGPVVVEALDPDVAVQITVAQSSQRNGELGPDGVEGRVELLPGFKFTGKMVKIMEFTGKIGKTGKR